MKPREFWFDKSGDWLDKGTAIEGTLYLTDRSKNKPKSESHDYHVIEKSAYDKAVEGLVKSHTREMILISRLSLPAPIKHIEKQTARGLFNKTLRDLGELPGDEADELED